MNNIYIHNIPSFHFIYIHNSPSLDIQNHPVTPSFWSNAKNAAVSNLWRYGTLDQLKTVSFMHKFEDCGLGIHIPNT